MINDLWYKNAVVYCLSVETFMDSNGDGVGDFQGLTRRLDYLHGLGVTCIWLMPFQPSPQRDNGYDITDYYNVDPRYGTLGDFVEFTHGAHQRGMRVLIDLVVNHTSDQHPWFQSARSDPQLARIATGTSGRRRSRPTPTRAWCSRAYRSRSGRATRRPAPTTSTASTNSSPTSTPPTRWCRPRSSRSWASGRSSASRASGWTRCRSSSPPRAPKVRKSKPQFEMLRDLPRVAAMAARATPSSSARPTSCRATSIDYFGDDGDRLHMLFNFPVNQNAVLRAGERRRRPLAKALEATRDAAVHRAVGHLPAQPRRTRPRPADRSDSARRSSHAFGPEKEHQLYDRGIRRRLAPMLDSDRRRLELAYSLMLTLPGTPVLRYGDEIAMGDDLSLPERDCARTPMQWSTSRTAASRSRQAATAGDQRRSVRLRAPQRGRAAPRPGLVPELARADDAHAQGSARDRLGRLRRPRRSTTRPC